MNQLQTMWSITRRKALTNCAHQYILRYSNNQNSSIRRSNNLKHSYNDIMIRATRNTMVERLEDLRNGKIWSPKMVLLKIKLSLKQELGLERFNQINFLFRSELIKKGRSRIEQLWNTELIKKLSKGNIVEWSCLDRTKPLSNGHIDIFCSPDIAFKLQNKWHLVRIDFQGENLAQYEDLELLSMVNWAKEKNFLPALSRNFIVHSLKFIYKKWNHRKYVPNETLLQQSKQLLEKDVNQMNQLIQRIGPLSDLSLIPFANSEFTCKKCPTRLQCSAFDNLETSKVEQQIIEYHNVKSRFESNR